ncbi:MAG: FAD-dependent oxidoreductase [Bacteroidales bacterium]|nr:FAD-dependent oxidoreductase [Bacteroidales bacterium]
MDRRDFLKAGGIAATAALVPGFAASCTKGQTFRDFVVKDSYQAQVVVVGGGPSGVAAALAAARAGMKTILIEYGSCLGGMATRGLVEPFMTCYDTTGEQMIIKGIFEEIVNNLVENGGAIHPKEVRWETPYTAWMKLGHDHETPFDPEVLKFVLDTMVLQAGIKVLYHTTFVKSVVKGDKIEKLVLLTKRGLESVKADFVIDTTGDGDVAATAGVPFTIGNGKGKVQPCTLFMRLNNIESDKLIKDVESHLPEFKRVNGVSYRALFWYVEQAENAGEWDIERKSVNLHRCVKGDEWSVNVTRILDVDALDPESLTAGEIEGRRQVQEVFKFFKKYVPGCKNATLMKTADTLGIRESRHIEGEFLLQADDLLNGVVPEDSILVASNSIDVHGGQGNTNTTNYTLMKQGRWYGVPYRCLVPKGIRNLLVAGRPISATSEAVGAVRVMPPCMAMGQAAGIAAAFAVRNATAAKDVDIDSLRKEIVKQGGFLG